MTSAKASRRVNGTEARVSWTVGLGDLGSFIDGAPGSWRCGKAARRDLWGRCWATGTSTRLPRAADPAATTPAAAKIVDHQRREFRRPIPNRLVGEFDTAEKEHLRQIA